MAKNTSGVAIFLIIAIIFTPHGSSNGQCLTKTNQKNRCQNILKELHAMSGLIREFKECLEDECILKKTVPNIKACKGPLKTITIPGYIPSKINKNLSAEKILQEMLKRIVIHEIHNKNIKKYFKSVKCYKECRKVRTQINRMKSWINKTQADLKFSRVAQTGIPPNLNATGAVFQKDWYNVQIQMLKNLNLDFVKMRSFFENSTILNKTCVIPVC